MCSSSSMMDMEIVDPPEHQSNNLNLDQSMKIIVDDDGFTSVESKTAKKRRRKELAFLKKKADEAKKAQDNTVKSGK